MYVMSEGNGSAPVGGQFDWTPARREMPTEPDLGSELIGGARVSTHDGERDTEPPMPAPDMVNHPPHYTSHPSGVECITITEHMGFCVGNAIKYLWRAGLKSASAIDDLKKARWYVEREIARREAAQLAELRDDS